MKHYILLWAIRILPECESIVRRMTISSGPKHIMLGQAIDALQNELGPTWEAMGTITTRQYYELRLRYVTEEDAKWKELLR